MSLNMMSLITLLLLHPQAAASCRAAVQAVRGKCLMYVGISADMSSGAQAQLGELLMASCTVD